MVKPGNCLGFPLQTFAKSLAVFGTKRDRLDCHATIEDLVDRFVNHTHCAATELSLNEVLAD